MALLSNNMRLVVIYVACLVGDPRWFWIIELTILTWVLAIGIAWLRKVESELASPRPL
jgi:hypothetical protein